jgi:hypothetical protein
MKKAPYNLPAAGALGEQLTFLDPPEFSPVLPRAATLADKLLDALLKGKSFTHPDWEGITQSWRLAATVQTLRDYGWPVDTLPVAAPTAQAPDRTIARYRLRLDAIGQSHELRRAVP